MRESLGKNKSYLKSKKLSIINNSCREVLTSILNIVISVIDICIIFAVLFLFVESIILLIALIADICFEEKDFVLYLIQPICKYKDLIPTFGVFASVSIVPLIGIVFAIINDRKGQCKKIDEQFAKFKNLSLYLVDLPFGSWNSLVINNYRLFNEPVDDEKYYNISPILYYKYCLCLVFNNECFQSYKFILQSIEIENGIDNQIIRGAYNFRNISAFTADTTGIKDENLSKNKNSQDNRDNKDNEIGRTQLSIMLKRDENNKIVDYFRKNNLKFRKLILYVGLRFKQDTAFTKWKNALLGKYKYLFPVWRWFVNWTSERYHKVRLYKIELTLETIPRVVNFSHTQSKYDIADIDIKVTKRRHYKISIFEKMKSAYDKVENKIKKFKSDESAKNDGSTKK